MPLLLLLLQQQQHRFPIPDRLLNPIPSPLIKSILTNLETIKNNLYFPLLRFSLYISLSSSVSIQCIKDNVQIRETFLHLFNQPSNESKKTDDDDRFFTSFSLLFSSPSVSVRARDRVQLESPVHEAHHSVRVPGLDAGAGDHVPRVWPIVPESREGATDLQLDCGRLVPRFRGKSRYYYTYLLLLLAHSEQKTNHVSPDSWSAVEQCPHFSRPPTAANHQTNENGAEQSSINRSPSVRRRP